VFKIGATACLIGITLSVVASAQVDPDEALRRIQEREAAAATQPSDQTEEIATLKSVIADQAKQIDALKAEIVSLRQTISLADRPPAASPDGSATIAINVQPKSTFESRAHNRGTLPMFMQRDIDVDAKIDAFVKQNHIDPAITASLYEGDPKVGMTEDEVRLIAELTPQVESVDGNIYRAWGKGSGSSETGWFQWRITIIGGIVTEIDKPDRATGRF
jgi:hypothetical protein